MLPAVGEEGSCRWLGRRRTFQRRLVSRLRPLSRANFAHAALLNASFFRRAFRTWATFFHHRFHNRFAFFARPTASYYDYADYGGCWRQA